MQVFRIGLRFITGHHRRTAYLGFLIGIFTAMSALFAVSFALIPKKAEAAPPVTCYFRAECLKAETKQGNNCDQKCDEPGVVCHCFEPGHGCKDGGGACYVKWPAVKLSVSIGGATKVLDFADYVAKVFNFAIYASLTVAGVMFVMGGFRWLNAGMSADAVNAGKKRIMDALIGTLITLGAVVILSTINPDILLMRLPKIPLVKKVYLAACAQTEQCVPCGKPYVVMRPIGSTSTSATTGCGSVAYRPDDGPVPTTDCKKDCPQKWTDKLAEKNELSAECVGKSCKLAGCTTDAKFRCRAVAPKEKTDYPECKAPPGTDPKAPEPTGTKYACVPCKQDGEKCAPGGKNNDCCGGFCGGESCTAGLPGDPCKNASDCQNGLCTTEFFDALGAGNKIFPYSCSSGGVGSPCNDNNQCQKGFKCSTFGRNTCSPGTRYSYCDADDECQSGLVCGKSGWFLANVCLNPGEKKDECNTAWKKAKLIADCITGCTAPEDELGPNQYCPEKMCVKSPQDITPGGFLGGLCSSGAAGTPCSEDKQCTSPAWKSSANNPGICIDNICMSGQLGELCRTSTDCESGRCYVGKPRTVVGKIRTGSICVSGGIGSRCSGDAKCDAEKGLSCQGGLCRFK